MSHTKGPWIVGAERHNNNSIFTKDGIVNIGSVNRYAITYDEARANAELFAAAPHLLDALKVCRAHLNPKCQSGDPEYVLAVIEQAIKIAEGNNK